MKYSMGKNVQKEIEEKDIAEIKECVDASHNHRPANAILYITTALPVKLYVPDIDTNAPKPDLELIA